ncbi:MAG: porin [Salibaculum sp.]|uniref:porin n=1 Tax=Salibaculum sp. TaxID=2855480 RepID=UPI002870311D|nr:porin [Salibaculum sp.]MDR9427834.1 porin [Salibaculum sp.]
MKSILLASASVFAFAGAAAAEGHTGVNFSGEANAEYNSENGYSTDAEATATLTQELDNGLTATAEITLAADEGDDSDELSYGDITLASDTASITFTNDLDGAAFSAVSDTIGIGDGEESGAVGVAGSVTMSPATFYISMPINEGGDGDTDDIEFGLSADVSGWTVGLGFANDAAGDDDGGFVAKASGTVSGFDLTVAAGEVDGDNKYDVAVSYPIGAVTIGANTDDSEESELTLGYAEGPVSVDVAVDTEDDYSIDGSYDVGNGLVVYAGIVDAGDDMYVGGAYDLGGGASFTASFVDDGGTANGDNEIGAQDYADGTTVGVSFAF